MSSTNTRGNWLRRRAIPVVAAAVGLATAASVAVATSGYQSGTTSDSRRLSYSDTPWTGAGTGWTYVPYTSHTFTVPAGQTRIFDARFTAESQVGGSGWAAVRFVYTKSGVAGQTELNPAPATDFAFDSPGGEPWDSNAIERSSNRLGPGTYTFTVQAIRVNGASSLRLDDYHTVVEAVR